MIDRATPVAGPGRSSRPGPAMTHRTAWTGHAVGGYRRGLCARHRTAVSRPGSKRPRRWPRLTSRERRSQSGCTGTPSSSRPSEDSPPRCTPGIRRSLLYPHTSCNVLHPLLIHCSPPRQRAAKCVPTSAPRTSCMPSPTCPRAATTESRTANAWSGCSSTDCATATRIPEPRAAGRPAVVDAATFCWAGSTRDNLHSGTASNRSGAPAIAPSLHRSGTGPSVRARAIGIAVNHSSAVPHRLPQKCLDRAPCSGKWIDLPPGRPMG